MYVTYDLQQNAPDQKSVVIRGAKEVHLSGPVRRWEIGEFETQSGKKVYSVQIDYGSQERRVIELPSHAQNVQIHVGTIPKEYETALKSAA